MLPDQLPFDPGDTDDDHARRRTHVLWYGAAVMVVLVAIIVLQVVA